MMKRTLGLSLVTLLIVAGAAAVVGTRAKPDRDRLAALVGQGNYRDAYDGYRTLVLDPESDPKRVGEDLGQAIACLGQLGRIDETDALIEGAVSAHETHWRLLQAAAKAYLTLEHQGFIVAGEFTRGTKRGGGEFVTTLERDRARAVQILLTAVPLNRDDPDRSAVARFDLDLADALLFGRRGGESWRLQTLTSPDELPDRQPGYGPGTAIVGAPVDADGDPVYYPVPRSLEAATSDGERWRWALAQAPEDDPARLNESRGALAGFLHDQFGVQTIAVGGYGGWDGPAEGGNGADPDPHGLQTLTDDETVARLATGVTRFTLPEEFNFIRIFRAIADDPETGKGEEALTSLATEYENRRQRDRAAEVWRRSIREFGAEAFKTARLDQLVKPWGQFEAVRVQPSGRGAEIDLRYRNGDHAAFTARPIQVDRVLADLKAYLRSGPPQIDWSRLDIGAIGYRIVVQDQAQYVGPEVASWGLDLDPPKGHHDATATVTTPLQAPGAYLVTATLKGGNTSRIVVWVTDTVLLKKPTDGGTFLFAADSATGRPVSNATIDLFGFRQRQIGNKNEFRVDTKSATARTDETGRATVTLDQESNQYQWLITARGPGDRTAFLGFTHAWRASYDAARFQAEKTFLITDRPVYRPNQVVKFKFWVGRAQYEEERDASAFANREFPVQILDPQGNKVVEASFRSDAFGGFDGTYEVPSGAPLGVYQAFVVGLGGGSFRVEEYKKPEYEVTIDAPDRPVTLGEAFDATIRARYFFGAPVAEARVKYKITRSPSEQDWFPAGRWDWLYGPGYWWFADEYPWFPGWSHWGCLRPAFPWWPRPYAPPEVVAEAEVPIGPDGTVQVRIDSATARAQHGDQDHRYEITAEVVDRSRRTVVGTGSVNVARHPFRVHTWVDRGHYRVGDRIVATLSAQTLDHKPVVGQGTMTLLKVSYDPDGTPREAPVQSWDVATGADGLARQEMKASAPGQYRVSATITDAEGRTIEGGYLLTVAGEGFDGSEYRFNDLELIPDRREYAPGDTVRLMVNTNRAGGTVLLFVRPVGGVYLPPKVLTLEGKSTVVEIGVAREDMPNIFVEAEAVFDGRLHTATREIAIPPESRVLGVEVVPSAETYKPGQEARVRVKLTGPDGKPFVGSTALAVYDKSVESIAGGTNVPDIKAFFWQWRRNHAPNHETNLDLGSGNLLKPGETAMQPLGVLGFGNRHDLDWGWDGQAAMMGGMGGMGDARGRGLAMEGVTYFQAAPAGSVAVPKAAAPISDVMALDFDITRSKAKAGGGPVEPAIRAHFAETASWSAALTTGADGTAEVAFPMPESLTTWKVKAWGMGAGTRVGEGSAEVVTTKDLLLRLQAPRFFVQKDEVVLSANVHNTLETKKEVQVSLEVDGGQLVPLEETSRTVTIDAGAEARIDWRVRAVEQGEAVVRMKALTDEESDAMEMRFPVHVHGIEKFESWSGAIRPGSVAATVAIRVPEERRPEQTRLEVRYSPTLAGAMVDALPYLAEFPYGCTEQTLNRFVPTVITQKVLINLGLDLKAIRDRRTNLNAQQIGDPDERSKEWNRFDRNPVFDEAEVSAMVRAGLQTLADQQLADGGWGWFSGSGERSTPHTTAVVVHGLQVARGNDVALPEGLIGRGIAWLTTYQQEQVRRLKNFASETRPWKPKADDLDALVFLVLTDEGVRDDAMLAFLDRDRTNLSIYAKALLGLALERLGEREKLAMVLRNLSQYLVRDEENQTAHLRLPNEATWWHWYGRETEANAFYLALLARTEPKGETAAALAKYLVNNRSRGASWDSTRDTAYCVEALAAFLRASGEERPDMTLAVEVDGEVRKEVRITPQDLFTFDNAVVLSGDALGSGAHDVTLRRQGRGPVYFNAYLTNFTLEDPITKAGLEIKIERSVFKIVEEKDTATVAGSRGQALDQRVAKVRREPIEPGSALKSGDLVEVELTIESKNDYEYLIFEDFKAAGFEPADLRSGYNGNALGAYVEFRDEKVAFFVRSLARGRHSVSYRLRAEMPGQFSALPARAWSMYAPELRANSDETDLRIED